MKRWLVITAYVMFLACSGTSFALLNPDAFEHETLIVSNYPESIEGPGLIFDTVLKKKSLRVLYHHKNNAEKPLFVLAQIQNFSGLPTKVFLQKGSGGPSEDVVFAGHTAAKQFLEQLNSIADVVNIAPFSSKQLLLHKIKPSQVSSGLFRIEKTDYKPLSVKLSIIEAQYPHLSAFYDVPNPLSQFRPTVLKNAYRKLNISFDAKQDIMAFEIGGKPYLRAHESPYALKGNYGVIHDARITLRNSTAHKKKIQFFFSPKKYESVDRAVLLLNGELIEIGLLSFVGEKVSIQHFYSVELAAGEQKDVTLVTFPQSGCFYPIDIILKARDEQL